MSTALENILNIFLLCRCKKAKVLHSDVLGSKVCTNNGEKYW